MTDVSVNAADVNGGPLVEVFADVHQLAIAAAEHVVHAAATAVFERGRFVIALSGGSTPKALFRLLAQPPLAARIAWEAVHVCWGDERCVAPDHADSNYHLAHEELLSRVPIPASNVHRMRGELEPAAAAIDYEARLRALLGEAPVAREGAPKLTAGHRFDLVLLGLGTDGHTASLFPGGQAVHERERWVVAEYVQKVQMWRLTITPPVINASAEALFLAAGTEKADVLRRLLNDAPDVSVLPAQVVAPTRGVVRWMVDADAASKLHETAPD